MNIYAQSGEKDDIAKDRFYQIIARAYGSITNTDMQMGAGELNVKLGPKGTKNGVIETNNNGQRVTDSEISKSMNIASKCFPPQTYT